MTYCSKPQPFIALGEILHGVAWKGATVTNDAFDELLHLFIELVPGAGKFRDCVWIDGLNCRSFLCGTDSIQPTSFRSISGIPFVSPFDHSMEDIHVQQRK